MTEAEDMLADYHALGFTLGPHPLALLRKRLAAARISICVITRSLPVSVGPSAPVATFI